MICLSSPLTKRLRLYQWGHDEFSADTHSVWALSEHAFKWTLSSSASYYTRISKLYLVKHYIKHNNNNRPSPPSSPPLHFLLPSLSHFLLWHFSFLVHITKDSFHLLFMMDSFTFFFKALLRHIRVCCFSQSNHKESEAITLNHLVSCLLFFPLPRFRTVRWER